MTFNHDFWKRNTPYRATYPACRAVISAETLERKSARRMVRAIQSAYYQEARNPSLEKTLAASAKTIGLDEHQFVEALRSEETEQRLQQHLSITHQLQVTGFPALFYVDDKNRPHPLTLGFSQADNLERKLGELALPGHSTVGLGASP